MKTKQKCESCGNNSADLLYNELSIVKCCSCGLVYRDADLNENYYNELELYKDFLKDKNKLDLRKRNAENRFKILEKQIPLQGKYLDIGTNEGMSLQAARRYGLESLGCEPNRYAAQFAASQGLKVINKKYQDAQEELKKSGPFNMVSLFHVLEHIRELNSFLGSISENLLPNGYLIIEVPDFSSPLFRIFRWEDNRVSIQHLYYFTGKTLSRMLENNGYRVVFCRRRLYEPNIGFIDSLIRLPLFSELYLFYRFFKRRIVKLHQKRKNFDFNLELWTDGHYECKKHFLSFFWVGLVNLFNRGDELFIIAQKND